MQTGVITASAVALHSTPLQGPSRGVQPTPQTAQNVAFTSGSDTGKLWLACSVIQTACNAARHKQTCPGTSQRLRHCRCFYTLASAFALPQVPSNCYSTSDA
jgi:hypothetical protein